MEQDLIYLFDKITKLRSIFGEIQSDFNIGLTIDGSKDSCSVIVHNFDGAEIEPYTILWHGKTNTWWIVSHDKVERYQNEQGFVYTHELELLGAIDLLNARDLTDCGFNDNTYSIRQFIERLFSLSNIEYPLLFDSGINQNFLAKNVNFIKTFENYTLLSALREFLDAYNMCPKLTFDTTIVNNKVKLYYARLKIIPKTGDNSLPTHIIEDFDDARETKTMDKESFGTCVVSNAENVISSKEKIYPSNGTTKLSSTELLISSSNAVLRLPSKVFKGNYIKVIYPYFVGVSWGYGDYHGEAEDNATIYYPYSATSAQKFKTRLISIINGITTTAELKQAAIAYFEQSFEEWVTRMNKAGTITLYEGNKLVPTFSSNSSTVKIEKGDNVPYLATIVENDSGAQDVDRTMVFCDKETRDLLPLKREGIAWERGSDLITGFDFIGHSNKIKSLAYTDLQEDVSSIYYFNQDGLSISIQFPFTPSISGHGNNPSNINTLSFIVNYVPMDDIKIKVDNQRTKKDIQLYNQNGKITDNFALSKLLNSYSKEISSDNVVRYMQYTNFNDVPKVGSFVTTPNGNYIINNVSMTFTQNESSNNNNFNYYIDCEFNMSKAVSVKSLMVNPNTNIRDYGIPQRFNVKRKQLFRDYYEINYNLNNDNEGNYYLDPSNIFRFEHDINVESNFTAVMKLTYQNQVEGQNSWYYQLETTNYYMNKMLYILLDFKDNNIIGYGSQNVFSGFDVSRIFSGLTDTINTPISYVDDNGNVKDITIKLANNENLTDVYDDYQEESGGSSYTGNLYSYSVFIPQYIFDNVVSSIDIEFLNYNKDALEVPVFEYACQIDDSDDVLIGDNILTQYDGNIVYFYGFIVGDNLTQDNVNDSNSIVATTHPIGWTQNTGATIDYESFTSNVKLLRIKLYSWQRWDIDTIGFTNGSATDISQYEGKDIAIFRKAFDISRGQVVADDLLFIAKKVPFTNVSQDGLILTLQLNHYKLN